MQTPCPSEKKHYTGANQRTLAQKAAVKKYDLRDEKCGNTRKKGTVKAALDEFINPIASLRVIVYLITDD